MKKLICFDLDGTLISSSTWEAFNGRLGISPEDDYRLFTLYREGNLTYANWMTEIVKLYKENSVVTKKDLEAVAEDMMARPDAQAAIDDAKTKGYHVIMLSGAMDVMAKSFATRFGIGEWFAANKAVFNENDELIDIEHGGDEREAKLLLLKEFCLKNDYELSDAITVADGGNDVEISKVTKCVMLGNNKELAPFAWKQIENLSELKDLL